MAGIFPLEIWDLILSHVESDEDLAALAWTCRSLFSLTVPHLHDDFALPHLVSTVASCGDVSLLELIKPVLQDKTLAWAFLGGQEYSQETKCARVMTWLIDFCTSTPNLFSKPCFIKDFWKCMSRNCFIWASIAVNSTQLLQRTSVFGLSWVDLAFQDAAAMGNLDILKWIETCYSVEDHSRAFCEAVHRGHFVVAGWILSLDWAKKEKCIEYATAVAEQHEQWEAVDWLKTRESWRQQ